MIVVAVLLLNIVFDNKIIFHIHEIFNLQFLSLLITVSSEVIIAVDVLIIKNVKFNFKIFFWDLNY